MQSPKTATVTYQGISNQLIDEKQSSSTGPMTTREYTYDTRAEMSVLERALTERVPGPLNLEPWAGSEYGNDMGFIETLLGGGG